MPSRATACYNIPFSFALPVTQEGLVPGVCGMAPRVTTETIPFCPSLSGLPSLCFCSITVPWQVGPVLLCGIPIHSMAATAFLVGCHNAPPLS